MCFLFKPWPVISESDSSLDGTEGQLGSGPNSFENNNSINELFYQKCMLLAAHIQLRCVQLTGTG